MIYIPTSLDQPVGAAFGVQAGLRSYHRRSSKVASPKSARLRRLRPLSPPLDGDLNPSSRPSRSAACRPSFSCRPEPLSVSCRLDPGGNAAQHAEAEFRVLPTSAREQKSRRSGFVGVYCFQSQCAGSHVPRASPAESSHSGPSPAVSISRPSIAKLSIVEAVVKRFGRGGEALNFGGAPTYTACHCVETFDGETRSRVCVISRMSSIRALSSLRTAFSNTSQSGY
jgi:hypothetical protein